MSRTTFLAFTGAALAIGTLASTTASAGFPQGHPSSTARVGFSNVHQPQVAVNRFSNVHLPQAAINRVSNVHLPQVAINRFSNVHAVPSQNNSSQPNTPGGATDVFNRAKPGDLSGPGVPGGLKPGSPDSNILNGSGSRTSITPLSTSDTAKIQIGGIQSQQGGAVGNQPKDGFSVRANSILRSAAQKAQISAGGTAAGVQPTDVLSPAQTSNLRNGAQKAKDSATGNAAGVQAKDPGVHLSNAQLQAIRNLQVNPVVNPALSDDPTDAEKKRQKEIEFAKHVFDDFKPKEVKPIIMPAEHINGHVPTPPKPNTAGQ